MTTLHMKTEQVRDTARQLSQTALQMDEQANHILSSAHSMAWSGPTRDAFIDRLSRLVQTLRQKADEADLLSQRMNREVEEWENVAAGFGMGSIKGSNSAVVGGGSNTLSLKDRPPQNMKELAKLVMEGDGDIRIYQTGENEYLMVIKGTSFDPNASNNWGSAVTTGMNLSSDFQDQVALALMGLPVGAIVHMAGHSQGGIVAQNLAANKQIRDHCKIDSVTTFGSPASAPENSGTRYQRFAADGDVVPYLEGRDAYTTMLLAPIFGLGTILPRAILDRAPQTSIPSDFSGGVFGPHDEYRKSSILEKITDMPFKVDEKVWDGRPTIYDPGTPHSGLAVVQKNLADGLKVADSTIKSAGSAISNAAQTAANATGSVVQSTGNFFSNLF